ncbi:MAG: hypothetical protein ACKOF3_05255 [Spartobacteria bacterium]
MEDSRSSSSTPPPPACSISRLAIGARENGLCLDGQHIGNGVHGILVDKPDYGTTVDRPLIEGCKVSRFSVDGVRRSRIWCFRGRGNMFSENKGHGFSVRGSDGFVLDKGFSLNGAAGYASIGENNAATITGNMIYRSGRPVWNRPGEDCSAHIVFIGARGVTVTGNTMVAGLDDENNDGSTGFSREENWSPDHGIVAEGLRNVVIKDNPGELFQAA